MKAKRRAFFALVDYSIGAPPSVRSITLRVRMLAGRATTGTPASPLETWQATVSYELDPKVDLPQTIDLGPIAHPEQLDMRADNKTWLSLFKYRALSPVFLDRLLAVLLNIRNVKQGRYEVQIVKEVPA